MKLLLCCPALVMALLAPSAVPLDVISSGSIADPKEVAAVIRKFKEKDPGLARVFAEAQGYAVFPTVGKGGIGVGAARGKGYVYQRGRLVGRSTLTQVTIGLQLDAQASAVALTARASADLAYRNGVAIVTMAKGGLMYEASVGGQKFSFKPIGKTS